ncbi:MAG: hypothetical protein Kow0092_28370 [Deferrisomatales bacterium]
MRGGEEAGASGAQVRGRVVVGQELVNRALAGWVESGGIEGVAAVRVGFRAGGTVELTVARTSGVLRRFRTELRLVSGAYAPETPVLAFEVVRLRDRALARVVGLGDRLPEGVTVRGGRVLVDGAHLLAHTPWAALARAVLRAELTTRDGGLVLEVDAAPA